MREILIKWLHEGLKLETGEEIYLPVDSEPEQRSTYKNLRKELDILKCIDPVNAVKLRISTSYKDSKMWVVIKKISVTPLVAFKKGINGVERVKIEHKKGRTHATV